MIKSVYSILENSLLTTTSTQNLPHNNLYPEFTSYTSAGNLKACLTEDLRICQEEDSPATFYKIIPDLYQKFPAVTTGNSSILHLIVSCIDSQQLHTIVCKSEFNTVHIEMTFANKDTLLQNTKFLQLIQG